MPAGHFAGLSFCFDAEPGRIPTRFLVTFFDRPRWRDRPGLGPLDHVAATPRCAWWERSVLLNGGHENQIRGEVFLWQVRRDASGLAAFRP